MSTDIQVRGTNDVVDFVPAVLTGVPSSGTLNATSENATAQADYSFTTSGFVISNLSYSLGASNNKSSFAQLAGIIHFTPKVDVDWQLSGSYSWSGNWANGVGFFARIREAATENEMTRHYYDSAGVLSNVNYTIGSGVGNVSNIVGPTSGILQAGVEYDYYFGISVDNNMYSPQVGTATGDLSLTLIPEPATIALLSLGGVLLRRKYSYKS